MKEIIISKNDAGQRVDKFLVKTFKKFPISMMYKYIRKKDIKINKKRCQISTKLCEGDVLSLYVKDEFLEEDINERYDFLKASTKLNIVYEDENILLLNKPQGLLVHADKNTFIDTLICRVLHYLYDKKEFDPKCENSFTPALVNRIDRNTSGIVICAKNAHSLRILNEKLKNREIEKYYLALVYGKFRKKERQLTHYLMKNEDKNRVYIYNKQVKGSKTIKTEYKVIKEYKNDTSLIEVHLLTGRTHQIRAHMAYVGHPLVGDGKYGDSKRNKEQNKTKQMLCSYKLIFNFSSPADELEYLNQKEFSLDKKDIEAMFC